LECHRYYVLKSFLFKNVLKFIFQTSTIESEIKSKRKHLSCSLPLLYMSYSMKKQTPHLIFIQYESEKEREVISTIQRTRQDKRLKDKVALIYNHGFKGLE
jgi:hypothetical protein